MRSTSKLVLLCLTLFLALLPLGVTRPGLPVTLKADEPAYYLASLSLARDGDLRCEPRDLARLWEEFPFLKTRNLILMTDDGWRTVYFGKPYVYSLLTAPLTALFGAGGMVAANLLMLAAMIAMGAVYLSRFNREAVAVVFAAGFFLLSTAFSYAFWLQPEIFNMTAVCACLFFGLHRFGRPAAAPGNGWRSMLAPASLRLIGSGAALSLATYNKPVFALLGLPVLIAVLRRRGLRPAALWLGGAALLMALQVGGSVLLTGHPSAYLGVARAGLPVGSPDHLPVRPEDAIQENDEVLGARNSWWWIFRLPEVDAARLVEDLGYFLWGRHVGLFPYVPFTVVALLLFVLHNLRSPLRWGILASLVGVAVFFFLWIPHNWHGGGGFVGNRYFFNTYPAFLFLVTRIRPRVLLPVAWAAGGLLLGPLLVTAYGAPVLQPTLQAHTRNFPFARLPLELTLLALIPGYHGTSHDGLYVYGRKDQLLFHGEEIWLQGAQRAELWLTSAQPLGEVVLQLRLADPSHPPTLRFGDARRRLAAGGEVQQLDLDPGAAARTRSRGSMYRLVVDSPTGRTVSYATPDGKERSFFLGTALTFMGSSDLVRRDLFAVRWSSCTSPERVAAGSLFRVTAELVNDSQESWPASGNARVSLSYHWLLDDGQVLDWEGRRTPLPADLGPGEILRLAPEVAALDQPGTYHLELEPVFEHVAWFSSRQQRATCRMTVEITPPTAPGAEEPES